MTKDNRIGLAIMIMNCTLLLAQLLKDAPDKFLGLIAIAGVGWGYYLLVKDGDK